MLRLPAKTVFFNFAPSWYKNSQSMNPGMVAYAVRMFTSEKLLNLEGNMEALFAKDSAYLQWLRELKSRILQCQIKASVQVNSEMLKLYWSIGADIVNKQKDHGWGAGIIPQLSHDLKEEFPGAQGFSERNLGAMKRFYSFYSQGAILHQLGAKLDDEEIAALPTGGKLVDSTVTGAVSVLFSVPWRHHIEIMSKTNSVSEALFYISKTVENGWSRVELIGNLKSGLYARQGKAPSNYFTLLPAPQGSLAEEVIRDPYNFDFITLADEYRERELEGALTSHITEFLLALGRGFAYVGRQVPITVGNKTLYIDLLFYHLELRCFVVIELKAKAFEAEFTGKLGVSIAAVDEQWRKPGDNPTIGLLLCKTKDNVYAEYSLRSSSQPISISAYEVSELLPDEYSSALPTIEEIESGLSWSDEQVD